ncbi:MAG: branched-chain amino acid ABC transporter substrate-binding protein, partial [Thermoleophilaceae bacterium]
MAGHRSRPKRGAALACLASCLVAVAGCGDDRSEGDVGQTLTIYSSFPFQGAPRSISTSTANGIRLALKQAGNRAGDFELRYVSLDDSTVQAGNWTPEATTANARRAAQDESAIAYIGDFNSGATAVSLPILNEAGLAQVSPSNTAVGLTTDEPGAIEGEPHKYYPTRERTYVRIVPIDTIQGAALATLMKEDRCRNVFIVNDEEVYGAGLARNIERSAEAQGVTVIGNSGIDPRSPNYRSVAARLEAEGAECFAFAGTTPNNAVALFKDVHTALPDAHLYGGDGVSDSPFVDPGEGGIPEEVAMRTTITVATLPPEAYPPAGRRFFEDYEKAYGDANPEPYALYGYEAARLVIDAIRQAGNRGNERTAVVEQLFRTRGRESVLGTYDIDENGDTTLTAYGAYRIRDGQLS